MTLLRRIARLRVTIGFAASAFVLWLSQPAWRTLAYGAAIASVGEALRIWAAGHLEKGREVTSSGPYRFTRHPLYVGSSIIGAGLTVASASVVVACIVFGYLAITLTAAIHTEEAHLTEKFGAAYPAYRAGSGVGEARRFSLSRAMMNREYRAVIGLVVAMAALTLKLVIG
jgi:protein-S-isoprenylcysteine O-methyltransferase Ste14